MSTNTIIQHTFKTTLNLTEELLSNVRWAVIGKVSHSRLCTYGLDHVVYNQPPTTYPPEFNNLISSGFFKKLSDEVYEFILNFGFYVEQARTSAGFFRGYPVTLQLFIYYLNLSGSYEVQKHEIKT